MTLAWSKNSRGIDHGSLFQEADRVYLQTDRELLLEEGFDVDEISDRAFQRSLRTTLPRLELLGHTLGAVEAEYMASSREWRDLQANRQADGTATALEPLSFAEFIQLVCRYPLSKLDDDYVDGFDEAARAEVQRPFAEDKTFGRVPNPEFLFIDACDSQLSYFGSVIGFLGPYSMLRVLAECPENLDLPVTWHYGPLVKSGWETEDAFVAGVRRQERFLIATEGSSDVYILRHAFALLRPEVQDFFTFMDVTERHPFSGTGALLKFAEGLVKIDVQNQVVFLFDNDAEGAATFSALSRFTLPANMRGMLLPNLEVFREFPARGPNGVSSADINGRAAAIECYLDLRLPNRPPAQVVWTNYKDELDVYHGRLEHKESYYKVFLALRDTDVQAGEYDFSKLRAVLDDIIRTCSEMAGQKQATFWVRGGIDP